MLVMLALNVLNHVMFLMLVLMALFHFVIKDTSGKALDGQITSAINSNASQLPKIPSKADPINFKQMFDTFAKTRLEHAANAMICADDPYSSANNKMLYQQFWIVFAAVACVYLAVVFTSGEYKMALMVLLENIGSFMVIAAIEAIFFIVYAYKYSQLVIDPNEITVELLMKTRDAVEKMSKKKDDNVNSRFDCKP